MWCIDEGDPNLLSANLAKQVKTMNSDPSEQSEQYIGADDESSCSKNNREVILQALRADVDIAWKQLDHGQYRKFDPKEMLSRVKTMLYKNKT